MIVVSIIPGIILDLPDSGCEEDAYSDISKGFIFKV
jgi:hypothetical protein